MKNEKQIASVPTVWYNAQDLKSSNEAGYYMLKDNRRSRDSVYDYEKGIVINDDIYLTLNYPKHELTKSEAQAFCRIKGGRIPDSFELWQIQMARDEIERSLARITYPQRELPADIMSCWCTDRSDSELSETRRPLLLIDGKRHNPGDSVQKHGDLVILNKQYVFVWENGKYVPKNLELWAVSEKNSLFALKADWSEVYLFTQCTHFVYNKCENWKTGCYRCPRCGNSDTGGELKGVFRTMPWVLRKKEAYITSVPNLTFVTVSEWLSGVVRSSVVGSVPVQVISNGVDCTRFYPHTDIQAIKQKYGCGNRFMIVGVSSHWSASKGLYDYYKLRELLPADQFVIVLVGITSEQKNNIPDGIIGIERTENLDELALIYSAADVVTSLSYQETFGLTIVEGFACGTPAVVYDITALPELIDSDKGLVVETGNMERLAEAIRQVCKTGKSFYSQACREVAQTRYDKFCQYEKYVELYEQALVSKKV